MAYCQKCGKPIGANDRFCKNCGAKLPGSAVEHEEHGRSPKAELVTRRCGYCEGTGQVNVGTFADDYRPCHVCDESGNVQVPSNYVRCRKCNGTGKEDVGEFVERFECCEKCHGIGWSPPPPVYR